MTTSQRAALVIVVLCVAVVIGCAGCRAGDERKDKQAETGRSDADEGHVKDLVKVTPEQRGRFSIDVEEAKPGSVDAFVELPGEVRPNGDRLAHIMPRFPGIVREVRRTVGEQVRAGEVLAVVESSESLAPYQLVTGIDGTIIQKRITQGEAIDREREAFIVADLRQVWIDLAVYQKDMAEIAVGQQVRVSAGDLLPPAEGTISYVTPTVDPPTRTVTARVVLDNSAGKWRPGMFVTARVLEPVAAPVVVPLSALQTFEGAQVVFVEAEAGFLPRQVSLGVRGETSVAVVSGLERGERYAATNSFLIKAELGKGEAEHED